MSKRQKENTHSQSREGQLLLSKRRQVPQRLSQAAAEVTWVTVTPLYGDRPIPRPVTSSRPTGPGSQEDSLEGGHSLPCSGTVTRPPRLSVSDLPPLHGPPLKVTPPWQLSPKMPRAASARVKLPPLPAAPEASGRRPRARSGGLMASCYEELVPPSPWGTMAAVRGQETPSPDSTDERAWRGSVARQGHRLPPLRCAGGVQLRTGTQPAWKHWGHTEMEELPEVQDVHGGKISGDMCKGLAPCLCEDTSIKSTCSQEQSNLCQEADAEPQGLPSTPSLTAGSTGEAGNSSDLLSPGLIAEPPSGSDMLWLGHTSLQEPEEKWEEEDLTNLASAEDEDCDPWGMSQVQLEEEKAEAAASHFAGDSQDNGPSELFPTSRAEETSGFATLSSSGVTCEERGTRCPAEQTVHSTETEDASKPLLHIKAEELEELEEDILSSLHEESTSMPYSLCTLTKDCTGETENYSQLVPPDLFAELWSLFNSKDMPYWDTRVDELLAKWEEEELPDRDAAGEGDSQPECALCSSLQDKESEPEASSLDSDRCGEGHSEPLPVALPKDLKTLACTLPFKPMEEPEAACLEADCSQASLALENPSGPAMLVMACLVPSQPVACCVPYPTQNMTTVPQPPAPRRWRTVVKRARWALRRLFSFSCLRGQPEE